MGRLEIGHLSDISDIPWGNGSQRAHDLKRLTKDSNASFNLCARKEPEKMSKIGSQGTHMATGHKQDKQDIDSPGRKRGHQGATKGPWDKES